MNNTLSYILAAFVGALLMLLLFRGCDKQDPEPSGKSEQLPEIKAGKAEAARIDSAVKATEQRVQAMYNDSIQQRQHREDSLARLSHQWHTKYLKAKRDYRKQPTLASCDSALTACGHYAEQLDTRLTNAIAGQAARDSVIESKARELEGVRKANQLLNANLDLCVKELEKPAPKPKTAIYATAGAEVSQLQNNIKVGATVVTPGRLSFEAKKGLLHDTYEAGVGYKLFEF